MPFISYMSTGMGAFYGKSDDEESFKTLTYAADRGMNFWDTSDLYGTSGFTLINLLSMQHLMAKTQVNLSSENGSPTREDVQKSFSPRNGVHPTTTQPMARPASRTASRPTFDGAPSVP